MAVEVHHARSDRTLHPDRTDGRPARRLFGGRAVSGVRLAAGAVPLAALSGGIWCRRPRRAGNSAGDAHPEARTGVQGSGFASAHFRLSRRAGGLDPVSAAPRPATRHGADRAALRAAQRRGGAVGIASVPRSVAGAALAGGADLGCFRRAGRRFRRGRATDDAGRGPSLRRRDRPCRDDALSAHRRHPLARRPASFPEQQPAVLVA